MIKTKTFPHESKPWNPIIASVFYCAGIIEKWGTGTLNIIDWCKENGNPAPNWEVRMQSVVATFLPSIFFTTGKRPKEFEGGPSQQRPESRPESRPKSLENEILNLLLKGPLSKAEIAKNLGHRHVSGGLKKVLRNLIAHGTLDYIPEKSNSRLQKKSS